MHAYANYTQYDCSCAGGDTKLAEELTQTGQKTKEYANKKAETKTTTSSSKVDSHYVS